MHVNSCAFANPCCAFFMSIAGVALMLLIACGLGYTMHRIDKKIEMRRMIKKAKKQAIAYIYHGKEAIPIDHEIDRFINNANLPNQASMSDEEKANLEKQINDGKYNVLFGSLYSHYN